MTDFTEQFDLSIILEKPIVMTVVTEFFENQLSSKQDYASVFTICDQENNIQKEGDLPIDGIVVFDGHGFDLTINIIRKQNLQDIFSKVDPTESLQCSIENEIDILKKKTHPYVTGIKFKEWYQQRQKLIITDNMIKHSGATCSFAKIYKNEITKQMKIVAEWIGDSPILIFVNGELVFQSELHSWSNEKEIQRLKEKGVLKSIENASSGFKIISDNRLIISPGKYIRFKNTTEDEFDETYLAMTRSLGHQRITGIETQKHTIECTTEDEVRVIAFSDGVGDIIHIETDMDKLKKFSAKEIVDLAEFRWKQLWYLGETGENKTRFPSNGYDDCCCALWEQKK